MQNRILLWLLILSGATALAYELTWTRMMALAFGSTTQSFASVLAVFFGGLAIGSQISSRFVDRVKRPLAAYGLVEMALGLSALALYPLLERLPAIFAMIDPGVGVAGGLARLVVALPLLAIPTILMGMALPLACRAIIVDRAYVDKATSYIYGFNTFGAFLGAYATTYLLLPHVGVMRTIAVTMGVNLLIGGVALILGRRDPINSAAVTRPSTKIKPQA